MTKEIKLCKDCKHCNFNKVHPILSECTRFYLKLEVSLIDGSKIEEFYSCKTVRRDDPLFADYCGKEGKYWEKKDE